MKKIVLLLSLVLFAWAASAQQKYVYCEIVGTATLLSNKVTIAIDYGQFTKFGQTNKLTSDDGKMVKFNSMIDALNYMGDQGWEFVQAYAVTSGTNTHVYHYLLKKKVEE